MLNSFFENAKLINDKFDIVPLMYGSLGLEYITHQNFNADDIDILIPEVFISERWAEFKSFLSEKGYILFDEHEHSFLKNGIYYSYASVEELESFAKIHLDEISRYCQNGLDFKVLSLEQYLKVYSASIKDGYRVNFRKKKDNEKIDFIKKLLHKQNV
ncbi:MAG: hypothetical protein E7483_06615 [Ruminococcaceae bacterium]|nr:hypothetical protein [Oscillospiraceae bacterium]